jgi:hypothetical protein
MKDHPWKETAYENSVMEEEEVGLEKESDRTRRLLDEFLGDRDEYVIVSSTEQRLSLLEKEIEDKIITISSKSLTRKSSAKISGEIVVTPAGTLVAIFACAAFLYVIFLVGKKTPKKAKRKGQKRSHRDEGSQSRAFKDQEVKKARVESSHHNKAINSSTHEPPFPAGFTSLAEKDSNLQSQPPSLCSDACIPIISSDQTHAPETVISSVQTLSIQSSTSLSLESTSIAESRAIPTSQSQLPLDIDDLFSKTFATSNRVGELEKTVEDADRVVQETKILRKMLLQNGEDTSVALQWALRRQESHRLIESQREQESRRLLWDGLHRQCDRQTSERQHEEVLEAMKHDPRWKEKLERVRDKCAGAISRLFIDGSMIYHVAKLAHLLLRLWVHGSVVSIRDLVQEIAGMVRTELIYSYKYCPSRLTICFSHIVRYADAKNRALMELEWTLLLLCGL